MSIPQPPVSLTDGCSVIFNNTLYAYAPDGFQSFPLKKNGKWNKLAPGVNVKGAVCVLDTQSNADSSPALYIVGGSSPNSTYQGLQRYMLKQQAWEIIVPEAPVTQNRLNHNAIFLSAKSEILIYSGKQDGTSVPTSDTFSISIKAPYCVTSHNSTVPPTTSPFLLPWSDTQVALLGGNDYNTKLMLFEPETDPQNAWRETGISLESPLPQTSRIKAILLTGADGSKHLYTYDLSVSPTQVNRTILAGENQTPISSAAPIVARSANTANFDDAVEKREALTVREWPEYNATLAPKAVRSQYSIAYDGDDVVAFVGGNDDDPIALFHPKSNKWVDASAVLGGGQQSSSSATSSTAKTSATRTSAPTTTPTIVNAAVTSSAAAATSSDDDPNFSYKVIGIAVGSVVGCVLIALVIILLCRRRRQRKAFVEAGHQRRASGIPDEKDAVEFGSGGMNSDDGARYQRHTANPSQASFHSTSILMGRVKKQQPLSPVSRKNGSNASDSSSVFNKRYKGTISKPIPQSSMMQPDSFIRIERPLATMSTAAVVPRSLPHAASRDEGTRRSSGWNKYWSGGSALNIIGFGDRNDRTTYGSQRSGSNSLYSTDMQTSRITQDSATVPPLNLNLDQSHVRLSQVATGSPTINQGRGYPLEKGSSGYISRSDSVSTMSSYGDNRHDPEDKTWTPVGPQGWHNTRAASSAYTDSFHAPTPQRTTVADSSRQADTYQAYQQPRRAQPQSSSDMSWLNLGNGN
jgi:hypothetical protein